MFNWKSKWTTLFIIVVIVVVVIYIIKYLRSKYYVGGDCEDCDYEGGYDGGAIVRLSVRDPWYTKMLKGEKVIEARVKSGIFEELKVGDPIVVVRSRPHGSTDEYAGGDYKYKTKVVRITEYDDLAALLKKEGVPAVYPDKKTAIEAATIFGEFNPPEKIGGKKVLAIELEKPHGVKVL